MFIPTFLATKRPTDVVTFWNVFTKCMNKFLLNILHNTIIFFKEFN